MSIIPKQYINIYEDYMLATGDVAMAAIIAVVERLSKLKTGSGDSWVSTNAQTISKFSYGIIAKKTVSKKISQLKKLQLIETNLGANNNQSFRVNHNALELLASKARAMRQKEDEATEDCQDDAPSTPAEYTPSLFCLKDDKEPSHTSPPVGYTSPLTEDTSPPAEVTLTSSRGDIKSNESNKERVKGNFINTPIGRELLNEKENSIRRREEEDLRTAEMLELTETSKSPTLLANREKEENSKPSLKTETIQNEEKEKNMNEDVRTFLKAYDRIPKRLRGKEYNGSITTLYKNFGDALERVIDTYGLDSCLAALEEFKQDSYWLGRGLPLRGIISQIEKYVKIASGETLGFQGVAKEEKVAPRAESAQIPGVQIVVQHPACDSPGRDFLRKKVRRVSVVMNMLEQILPGSLEEFKQEARDVDAMPPDRIEHWYQIVSTKWRETRGAYEPTGGTTPLC